MSLTIEKKALFERELRSGVNLFLGAGFSRLARNASGQLLPTGDQLKSLIIKEFDLNDYASLDLPAIYQIVAAGHREKLFALLKGLFTVQEFDLRYSCLRDADVRAIYTTNIDDLVYKIFAPRAGENSQILHDRVLFSAPKNPSMVVNYTPLHGCVRHDDPQYIFSAGQISSAFASDQETWYVFQRELQSRPTIFLGYAMRDAGVLQALHSTRENFSSSSRWILLRDSNQAAENLFRTFNFEIINGDIEGFLEYLSVHLRTN